MAAKTLRLLMPQWQGGNNPIYPLGAALMAWLAPPGGDPLVEVPVKPIDGSSLALEDGLMERKALLDQLRAARNIIEAYAPDRLVVFGGDCLVAQAPLSYLNERYGGELGVLWIDRHPDLKSPAEAVNGHTMVLRHLLGEGDSGFCAEVKHPISPARVMLAGLGSTQAAEDEVIQRLGLRKAGAAELAENSEPVSQWIQETGLKHLAVHLDVDVLSPKQFRSLQSGNPDQDPAAVFRTGEMTFPALVRLLADVAGQAEIVGLVLAEHMPWDSFNLQKMLAGLPILNGGS